MAGKPSRYLKAKGQAVLHLPDTVWDYILSVAAKDGTCWYPLYIRPYIPIKYHARMQKMWIVKVLNMAFAGATREYSLVERHKILEKCLLKCREISR